MTSAHWGCRNVRHQQRFSSELLSPGRSHNTKWIVNKLFTFKLKSWIVFDVSSENFWIHQDNILRWTSTFNKNMTQCCACIATINCEEIILENRLFPVTRHYNWAKSILFTCTESWYRGLEWTTHSGITVRQIFHQQILHWDWLWMTKGSC